MLDESHVIIRFGSQISITNRSSIEHHILTLLWKYDKTKYVLNLIRLFEERNDKVKYKNILVVRISMISQRVKKKVKRFVRFRA